MKDWIKNNKFATAILCIGILGSVLILTHVIWIQFFTPENFWEEFGKKDRPLYLVNIVVALAAIATAIFTWWKNVINNKQAEASLKSNETQQKQIDAQKLQFDQQIRIQNEQNNAQQRQIEAQKIQFEKQMEIENDTRLDSLYAKAVEFLKEENDLITRKGGVHILKDLALTSPKHTQKCIDLLCSLNEVWMPDVVKNNPEFFLSDWLKEKIQKDYLFQYHFETYYEDYKRLPDQISLSQEVLKHMSTIIKFISKGDIFNEVYDLINKYLCSAELTNIDFSKFKLSNTFLCGAKLSKANFSDRFLSDMNFYGASLIDSNFYKCHVEDSNFSSSILLEANLKKTEFISIDFSGASFGKAKLTQAMFVCSSFYGATLSYVDLSGTHLSGANFFGASLRNSNLSGADLSGADFTAADLTEANLSTSSLVFANFVASTLVETNFRFCIIGKTNFQGAEMKLVNLPTVLQINDKELNFNKEFLGFFDTECDFTLDQEQFRSWIKDEASIEIFGVKSFLLEDFERRIEKAYKVYQENTSINYMKNFDVIKTVNKEFSNKRNEFVISTKRVARGVLSFAFWDNLDDEDNFRLQLDESVISFLKKEKTEWYEDFKAEGIIKD